MKLRSPLFTKAVGLFGATVIRNWMSTLDYRAAFFDPTIDPVHPDYHGQKIYVFWHEYILFPLALRGHCNLAMLVSKHGDAEFLSRIAYHLGFDCVRGSTFRGGSAALRELVEKSRDMNLTITPDGPRGPRRTLAQGPVYLSSKLGLPIVAMGFGYDHPWRLKSWDRFAIPRPGSRARAVVSPMMQVPPNLDREGIEHYRVEVERMLNRLTSEAEAWAESGTHKLCEVPGRKEHPRRRRDLLHIGPPAPHLNFGSHSRETRETEVGAAAE